jgi:predicted nucleic acid-binding protein
MALGLDTSVVVRLLIGEPRAQTAAARRRIERAAVQGESIVISDLVAAETYHALRHHYGVPEPEAVAGLRRLVESGVIALDPPSALAALAAGAPSGLVDRLIVARYGALGAVTLTFDQRQGALEGTVRLRG